MSSRNPEGRNLALPSHTARPGVAGLGKMPEMTNVRAIPQPHSLSSNTRSGALPQLTDYKTEMADRAYIRIVQADISVLRDYAFTGDRKEVSINGRFTWTEAATELPSRLCAVRMEQADFHTIVFGPGQDISKHWGLNAVLLSVKFSENLK
ncbi:hypothetical protein GGS21DRAFT_491046 [Xylaria nigripes]|nr:hypothetical protein GGS21DRAFT_491046 [Xylaria nigripes]